jgi:type III pantothenate kinase
MNLCIDIGNTQSKVAVFNGQQELQYLARHQHLDVSLLAHYINSYSIKNSILSSVANHAPSLESYLQAHTNFIRLTHTTPIPIHNHYATPSTLGRDRIAAVIGGYSIYPNSALLVIDAGTCITYDYLNHKREYKGGGISPGMHIKFKALHTFTSQLPLIQTNQIGELIGNTTSNAIISGVMWGTVAEVDGIIERYKVLNANLKVLVTGGDALFFDAKLKNKIFVLPNLVLQGLNKILIYNVYNK